MATMLEVMRSRVGIQEMPGKGHNPVIVGWAKAIGHPEVVDDETAWCSICACSAALEADMPLPPHNVRLLARSWLTWGVDSSGDPQPGDVAIWPRGASSWQGHVNIVSAVRIRGQVKLVTEVRCIGGNQSNAVTETGWQRADKALGFRRGVPSTVKALRNAGSTTIKKNDNVEKVGIVAVFFTPIIKGIEALFSGAPGISSTEGLSYWQLIGKMGNDTLSFITGQPAWLAIPLAGAGLWGISYLGKRKRVQEHASGIPLSAEVAKLGD